MRVGAIRSQALPTAFNKTLRSLSGPPVRLHERRSKFGVWIFVASLNASNRAKPVGPVLRGPREARPGEWKLGRLQPKARVFGPKCYPNLLPNHRTSRVQVRH
jgi:hypothetical protein